MNWFHAPFPSKLDRLSSEKAQMIKLSRFKLLPLQQLQVSPSLFYDYDDGHRKHCKYCKTALAKVGLYCQFVLIVVCLHFPHHLHCLHCLHFPHCLHWFHFLHCLYCLHCAHCLHCPHYLHCLYCRHCLYSLKNMMTMAAISHQKDRQRWYWWQQRRYLTKQRRGGNKAATNVEDEDAQKLIWVEININDSSLPWIESIIKNSSWEFQSKHIIFNLSAFQNMQKCIR